MTDIETAKMSGRGQIIIPKGIRQYVHANEDTIFTVFPLDEETIMMRKLDTTRMLKDFRALRRSIKRKLSEGEIADEIRRTREGR